MLSTLVTLAASAEAEHHEFAVNPWIVGGVTIAVLFGMLFILLAFARGREHS